MDADGERARIRVRDRGPGVPAAERHLIFDPFARGRLASETRCGKGLGLFIARRIVEAHGGSHRSAIGATGDGVLHRAAAPGRGEAPIRVLIVDDHLLFAEAIRVTLTDMGMTVVGIVTTADEGLAAATAMRPDLVLVDLGLPDRNGLVLGADILATLPDTKVVALTALEDERVVQDALRLGFHGYLTKHTEADAVQAVRSASVMDGQTVFPHRLGRRHDPVGAEQRDMELMAAQLTTREREVLQLLAEGAIEPPDRRAARGLAEHRADPRAGHPVEAPGPLPPGGGGVRRALTTW